MPRPIRGCGYTTGQTLQGPNHVTGDSSPPPSHNFEKYITVFYGLVITVVDQSGYTAN